jgi:hypothetical protein
MREPHSLPLSLRVLITATGKAGIPSEHSNTQDVESPRSNFPRRYREKRLLHTMLALTLAVSLVALPGFSSNAPAARREGISPRASEALPGFRDRRRLSLHDVYRRGVESSEQSRSKAPFELRAKSRSGCAGFEVLCSRRRAIQSTLPSRVRSSNTDRLLPDPGKERASPLETVFESLPLTLEARSNIKTRLLSQSRSREGDRTRH